MYEIFEDKKSLAIQLCEDIYRLILKNANIKDILIGLSGGSSPIMLYELLDNKLLNSDKIKLSSLHFFQIDERWTTSSSERSNQKMILSKFSNLFSSGVNFYPMPSMDNFDDPNSGVEEYEKLIYNKLKINKKRSLDIGIFGLGLDGHTASLFPESILLNENFSLVKSAYIESQGEIRITLTKKILKNIDHKHFIVNGEDKGRMLKISKMSGNDNEYPYKLIVDENTLFYMDNVAFKAMNEE